MTTIVEMIPVANSSAIKAYGYLPADRVLAVQMKSGVVYHYADVPQDVFDGFVAAESVGKFFAANVRGKFEAQRQPDEQPEDEAA